MRRVLALCSCVLIVGWWAACDEVTAEEDTCLEVVDQLADAWEACGYDRETKRAELLAGFRDCDDVDSIRDEAVLRSDCLPALETLDCTSLETDALPAECVGQILF